MSNLMLTAGHGVVWRRVRFCGLLLVIWELLAWTGARALVVSAELSHADVVAVLSGAASYQERAQWAAQLFRDKRASRVVLTNDNTRSQWSNDQQRNPFFVELATEELRKAGVPVESIEVLPESVTGTYEEALLLRRYATTRGVRSMLVVTSASHSRRALWTLRRVFQGSDIEIGLNAAPAGRDSPAPATWWLSTRGWQMVAGEYFKFIYYRLHYG